MNVYVALCIITGATVTVVWLTLKILNKSFAPTKFADRNLPFLLADISRGEGQYLATYATLLGCKNQEVLGDFSKLAQQEVLQSDATTLSGETLTTKMAVAMGARPDVFAVCGT